MEKRRKGRRRRAGSSSGVIVALVCILLAGIAVCAMLIMNRDDRQSPEELLAIYMNHIPEKEYEAMYAMLNVRESGDISQEEFIERNSAIYEGIEAQNMAVEILEYNEEHLSVRYQSTFDTSAGEISFENEAFFTEEEERYELIWSDGLIFPQLTATDKVRVAVTEAKRGEIQDRNGSLLAGPGTASSVGIVPGKLADRDASAAAIAELLGIQAESVHDALAASWVQDDTFVPLKTIPKVTELDLMNIAVDEETLAEKSRQDQLLAIPGVMITDTEVRSYPLKEAASHLTGYVQNVTAEDIEEHAGEGYTATSVIGRSGVEALYEKELKGQNGCRIYIVNEADEVKKELAELPVQDGQNIRLTIDAGLQSALYAQFQADKSCSVAMNPYTGEVLALVSTPSFDSNDFILGMSQEQWTSLNEDERNPLYDRSRQAWAPGSTFKPVIAAVGLESGAIDPAEDYGNVGLSWQKDTSWGDYFVTTLKSYEPVILENALMYSDNIYFAKAALKIGADALESSLQELGFHGEIPFELSMAQSRYSGENGIETEIQLADSGYGQGEILVNPLHLACIYSALCNEGNMIKPYLLYKEAAAADYWVPGAFSAETAAVVLEGTKKVVNDANGTGYAAHREDVVLAGKTGTAEIKASQDDTTGTELGWFAVFTAEKTANRPIMLVSMAEDVKETGGSGYVVEKDRQVLEQWFGSGE